MKIVILTPFGVYPPRSGGHYAVLEPARRLARQGVGVCLFSLGVRRFEAFRHLRSFRREIEERLCEERMVSLWNWLDYLKRGRSGMPPLGAAAHVRKRASAEFRERCREADVLQFETPWLYGAVDSPAPKVLVAHNSEAALLESLGLDSSKAAEREGRAWREADRVICFTEPDRVDLAERYGERDAEVVPLGVDTVAFGPPDHEDRAAARARLGVQRDYVVLFTGAWHPPNRKAMERMEEWAAAASPDGPLYVVAGSVGKRPRRRGRLRVTGPLPSLGDWFHAANCFLNPVTEGSGANVKMLEYLAGGLPVITTPFGARGTGMEDGVHGLIREPEDFPETIAELRADPKRAEALGRAGREMVEAHRSWEAITEERLALLQRLSGDQG